MTTARRAAWVFAALLTGLLHAGCGSSSPPPPELEKGVAVIQYFSSPRYLNQSMFAATSATWKPSELVSYIFSDMGAAEWPPGENASAMEKEQARAARTPLIPADVRLVPLRPDARYQKQVVVKADDARGKVMVEGYVDPAKKPVLTREWDMPRPPAKKQ